MLLLFACLFVVVDVDVVVVDGAVVVGIVVVGISNCCHWQ